MLRRVMLALTVLMSLPVPAFAWGYAAHRYITRRAIDLLPPRVKPFFDHFKEEIVLRSIDPDLWRTAGWEDDPNHFLDFGVREYGAYPFAALPRDYEAALDKFGMATLRRNGLLPWREQEQFVNLRKAFEGFARRSPTVTYGVVLFTAAASHYIQDAHQPLHATNNYDGGMTGQAGVHGRFERYLFERFESRLSVHPAPPTPFTSARDLAFDTLLTSFQLVAPLLKADKDAIGAKDTYDDEYYEKFFTGTRPLLEKQLAASITATASLIVSAWEQAGMPALQVEDPRPVEKVRKP